MALSFAHEAISASVLVAFGKFGKKDCLTIWLFFLHKNSKAWPTNCVTARFYLIRISYNAVFQAKPVAFPVAV